MALVAPPVVVDRKRVKVYELKRNDWHDRGTGFCIGTFVNVSATLWPRLAPSREILATPVESMSWNDDIPVPYIHSRTCDKNAGD